MPKVAVRDRGVRFASGKAAGAGGKTIRTERIRKQLQRVPCLGALRRATAPAHKIASTGLAPAALFVRLNALMERCMEMLEMCETYANFFKLDKMVEGVGQQGGLGGAGRPRRRGPQQRRARRRHALRRRGAPSRRARRAL